MKSWFSVGECKGKVLMHRQQVNFRYYEKLKQKYFEYWREQTQKEGIIDLPSISSWFAFLWQTENDGRKKNSPVIILTKNKR